MAYFEIHVSHGSNSGYSVPIIADSAANAIPTAANSGMFATEYDVNNINRIEQIDAIEYSKLIANYQLSKTIIATEFYDGELHTTTITCKIPHHKFDIVAAAKAAAKDFCLSENGKKVYSGNCHSFNWGDLVTYVLNEYCEKHGFKIIHSTHEDEVRDFNEQLVIESEIFPEE